jgi:hypothetical protein
MAVLCAALCLPLAALAQVSNPGFETGDVSGWTVQTNGSAFSIQVVSGTTETDAGTIDPSLSDDFYAFTSQSGPGSSFLAQTFEVQPGVNRIFFDIAINNSVSDYFVPDPLSFDFNGGPNQQARFDILVPGAALTTADPDDIIVTGFQTQSGDPLTQDWTRYDIDVSAELAPFEGQTVTLRFVQVDNQGFFNLALDNLSVGTRPPPGVGADALPVPIGSLGWLTILSLLMVMVGLRFLRKESSGC